MSPIGTFWPLVSILSLQLILLHAAEPNFTALKQQSPPQVQEPPPGNDQQLWQRRFARRSNLKHTDQNGNFVQNENVEYGEDMAEGSPDIVVMPQNVGEFMVERVEESDFGGESNPELGNSFQYQPKDFDDRLDQNILLPLPGQLPEALFQQGQGEQPVIEVSQGQQPSVDGGTIQQSASEGQQTTVEGDQGQKQELEGLQGYTGKSENKDSGPAATAGHAVTTTEAQNTTEEEVTTTEATVTNRNLLRLQEVLMAGLRLNGSLLPAKFFPVKHHLKVGDNDTQPQDSNQTETTTMMAQNETNDGASDDDDEEEKPVIEETIGMAGDIWTLAEEKLKNIGKGIEDLLPDIKIEEGNATEDKENGNSTFHIKSLNITIDANDGGNSEVDVDELAERAMDEPTGLSEVEAMLPGQEKAEDSNGEDEEMKREADEKNSTKKLETVQAHLRKVVGAQPDDFETGNRKLDRVNREMNQTEEMENQEDAKEAAKVESPVLPRGPYMGNGLPTSFVLKGIHSMVSPPLLAALASCGWKDEIAFVDTNYPLNHEAERMIHLPGIPLEPLVTEVMKLWSLAEKEPVVLMLDGSVQGKTITDTLKGTMGQVESAEKNCGRTIEKSDTMLLDRDKFIERTQKAKFVVVTGEAGPWNNLILKKGLINGNCPQPNCRRDESSRGLDIVQGIPKEADIEGGGPMKAEQLPDETTDGAPLSGNPDQGEDEKNVSVPPLDDPEGIANGTINAQTKLQNETGPDKLDKDKMNESSSDINSSETELPSDKDGNPDIGAGKIQEDAGNSVEDNSEGDGDALLVAERESSKSKLDEDEQQTDVGDKLVSGPVKGKDLYEGPYPPININLPVSLNGYNLAEVVASQEEPSASDLEAFGEAVAEEIVQGSLGGLQDKTEKDFGQGKDDEKLGGKESNQGRKEAQLLPQEPPLEQNSESKEGTTDLVNSTPIMPEHKSELEETEMKERILSAKDEKLDNGQGAEENEKMALQPGDQEDESDISQAQRMKEDPSEQEPESNPYGPKGKSLSQEEEGQEIMPSDQEEQGQEEGQGLLQGKRDVEAGTSSQEDQVNKSSDLEIREEGNNSSRTEGQNIRDNTLDQESQNQEPNNLSQEVQREDNNSLDEELQREDNTSLDQEGQREDNKSLDQELQREDNNSLDQEGQREVEQKVPDQEISTSSPEEQTKEDNALDPDDQNQESMVSSSEHEDQKPDLLDQEQDDGMIKEMKGINPTNELEHLPEGPRDSEEMERSEEEPFQGQNLDDRLDDLNKIELDRSHDPNQDKTIRAMKTFEQQEIDNNDNVPNFHRNSIDEGIYSQPKQPQMAEGRIDTSKYKRKFGIKVNGTFNDGDGSEPGNVLMDIKGMQPRDKVSDDDAQAEDDDDDDVESTTSNNFLSVATDHVKAGVHEEAAFSRAPYDVEDHREGMTDNAIELTEVHSREGVKRAEEGPSDASIEPGPGEKDSSDPPAEETEEEGRPVLDQDQEKSTDEDDGDKGGINLPPVHMEDGLNLQKFSLHNKIPLDKRPAPNDNLDPQDNGKETDRPLGSNEEEESGRPLGVGQKGPLEQEAVESVEEGIPGQPSDEVTSRPLQGDNGKKEQEEAYEPPEDNKPESLDGEKDELGQVKAREPLEDDKVDSPEVEGGELFKDTQAIASEGKDEELEQEKGKEISSIDDKAKPLEGANDELDQEEDDTPPEDAQANPSKESEPNVGKGMISNDEKEDDNSEGKVFVGDNDNTVKDKLSKLRQKMKEKAEEKLTDKDLPPMGVHPPRPGLEVERKKDGRPVFMQAAASKDAFFSSSLMNNINSEYADEMRSERAMEG